jgi:hypothetical protein
MSFSKPYTYVDGNVLNASDHASNEQELQLYINQEILQSDIDNNEVLGVSLAPPKVIGVTNNIEFTTKDIYGINKTRNELDFSWFTGTTKAEFQGSANVTDYQSIPNSGFEVRISDASTAKVMITAAFKLFVLTNSTATNADDDDALASDIHLFSVNDSDQTPEKKAGTDNYVFQPKGTALSVNKDPGIGADQRQRNHRYIMVTRMLDVSVGATKFYFAINNRGERGNVNCQSVTYEVFYI